MSTPATLFAIYLGIGMLLLTLAVASDKKRTLAKALGPLDANALSAGALLFIALLWPVWLIVKLSTKQK